MSAFVGIINFDGKPVDQNTLRECTNYLARIGPDAQTTRFLGEVGFGHALLRTTWESQSEVQPIDVNGALLAVGDVRLDRRKELIDKLQGTTSRDLNESSDFELVIQAWITWQEHLLDHLIGDFSFAIWDAKRKLLFVARDPMGIRTFYYHRKASQLIFSNSLNVLSRFPGMDRTLNPQAVADFLLFGYNLQTDSTSFREIMQLSPAHHATISRDAVKERRYWNLPIDDPIRFKSDDELIDRFNFLFGQAVADRLRYPTVNIMVSSGLDSTSITAKALQAYDELGLKEAIHLNTGQDGLSSSRSEHSIVEKLAAYFKLSLTTEIIPSKLQFATTEKTDWPAPEINWHYKDQVHSNFIRTMSSFSPIALSGHGGDPLFRMNRSYMPSLAKQGRWLKFVGEFFAFYQMHGHRPPLGVQTFFGSKFGPKTTMVVPNWVSKALRNSQNMDDRIQHRSKRVYQSNTTGLSYRTEALDDLSSPYWQHVLPAHDSQVSGQPLEFRHPFFDVRLMRFMLQLSSSRWLFKKSLLRQAMKDQLPGYVLTRKKVTYDDAFNKQFLIGLQSEVFDEIRAGVEELSEFVDVKVYNLLCNNLPRLRQSEVSGLLAPVYLALWCKNHGIINGKT